MSQSQFPPVDSSELFLLQGEFADAAFPGERFFCRHNALVEGVLASIPALADRLTVRRVGFARPREEVIARVGEAHQALPLLVLPAGVRSAHETGESGGRAFVAGAEPILAAFAELYGAPPAHP